MRQQCQTSFALLKPVLITMFQLFLSNYQLFQMDRKRHGGGIAIYVCTSLTCNLLLEGGPFGLEFLSISQYFLNSFCLCHFNHPPSSPVSIFDNLCTTLQIVHC